MQPAQPGEQPATLSIQENDAFWSFVNFDDDATAAKDFWMPTDMWCNSTDQALTGTMVSSDYSPTTETCCDGRYDATTAAELEAGNGPAVVEDGQVAKTKRAKRQAQNRIAQQAFRARKEKLVRNLSDDLVNLQSQYDTTKAENERLSNDLRLAQTELAAIRSVLQRPAASSFVGSGGVENVRFNARLEPPGPGGAESCTLTLHISLDSVMAERLRAAGALATPPESEKGEGGVDVDLGASGEPLRCP